jgi:hypothetical protein
MENEKTSLKELASLFTRLGLTAFGGPAAHIAMMQTEVVDKRKWMDHQHFMDLIGATNLIPGPNSTEMAIRMANEWDAGGYISNNRCIPPFIHFRWFIKSAGSKNANISIVFIFSGWCKYCLCSNHPDCLYQSWRGNHYWLAYHPDCITQYYSNIRFPEN